MSAKKTIDEFSDGLDRWGSDLERWPESTRAQSASLLNESAHARQLHAQALRIEALLATEHQAPATLRGEILKQLPGDQPAGDDVWQRLADWFAKTLWKPTLAAACILAMGFSLGFTGDVEDLSNSDLEEVSMLAFFDNYQEIDDAY